VEKADQFAALPVGEPHRSELIATGRLSRERALEVGERIAIVGRPGVVRSIEPVLAERELHLVIQLFRDELASWIEEGVAKGRA